MEYTFSWGTFMFGIAIVIASACLVVWYRPFADNFAGGLQNYEKVKLAGIIGVGVGLIIMTGLHTIMLGWILEPIFGGGSE